MSSFGWKRKSGSNISKTASTSFEKDTKDDNDDLLDGDIDWISLAPKRRFISLEDALGKSERLKNEGIVLAESERYWEAIKKWDEAVQLNPINAKIVEMKAQALMALNELHPAATAAQRVVEICPTWWVGHQTLGRAQLNLGEVRMALHSFSTAVHLNPADRELWEEDLIWSHALLTRKQAAKIDDQQSAKSTLTITELSDVENNVCASGLTSEIAEKGDNAAEKCDITGGKCNKTGEKFDQNLQDESLMNYSKVENGVNISDKMKKLKSVPNNYVVMRDK